MRANIKYLFLKVAQLGPGEEDADHVLLEVSARRVSAHGVQAGNVQVSVRLQELPEHLPRDESEHPQRLGLTVALLDLVGLSLLRGAGGLDIIGLADNLDLSQSDRVVRPFQFYSDKI